MVKLKTLKLTHTIQDALGLLEQSEAKICVITDKVGQILSCVTDGDIRRALLSGKFLESPLKSLDLKKPITAINGTSNDKMLSILRKNKINDLVLINKKNIPQKIISRSSLENMLLLSPPHLGESELNFVKRAFEDNWIAPAGPNLELFEKKIAKQCGKSTALAVSSGTAALHLSLRVVGIRKNDKVYVSDLTFIATLQPILYENAVPVLIDSEPIYWNMSSKALERKLNEDKATNNLPKAIIVAHIYGQSANLKTILELAAKFEVPVIEDAAESLGAEYDGKPSGSHGLLSVVSFNGNKIITTSGGGSLMSNNPELINNARNLATQGREDCEHYQHSKIAYNYRMSNVLAGIGLGQLDVLEKRVSARRRIHKMYVKNLSSLEGLSFQSDYKNSVGNRWLTVIHLDANKIPIHSFKLMRKLKSLGVETRPGWKPMHLQPICSEYEFVTHDEISNFSTEHFFRALCLPSGSGMSESDVERVSAAIIDIIQSG